MSQADTFCAPNVDDVHFPVGHAVHVTPAALSTQLSLLVQPPLFMKFELNLSDEPS